LDTLEINAVSMLPLTCAALVEISCFLPYRHKTAKMAANFLRINCEIPESAGNIYCGAEGVFRIFYSFH
jgi:hypothetical protein